MANAMVSGHLRSCLGRRHKTRSSWIHCLSQWCFPSTPSSAPVSARVICQRAANLLAAAKEAEEKSHQVKCASTVAAEDSTRQRRVLLLGKPDEAQLSLKQLWQSLDFQVMTARSSLGAIMKQPFTLCDYVMIDVEGLQESSIFAISRLAAHFRHDLDSRTQLIALTASYDRLKANLLQAGADHCLDKPLTRQKLTDLVSVSPPVETEESLPVLLLEDDIAQQHVMAKYFQDANHPVTLAKTVTEACRLVREHRYGLIITDMGLPDGEGVTLIEMAQHHSESQNRDTPIIAVTANAEDFRDRCLAAGAEGVYAKPVAARQIQAWFKQYGIGR